VTEDHDFETTPEEPSAEDFEAAAEERPQVRTSSVLVRILKAVGALFVVIALLLYLVVPFYDMFRGVPYDWRRPLPNVRPIPVAPEPTSAPVGRA
jgi:hypothetical protein